MGEKFVGFILFADMLIARSSLPHKLLVELTGEVEMIGFENYYRSTAWTPMIVRLSSTAKESADYQLRVYQEDLDRDRPIFTRTISVTGATEEGAARDQRFRMYFKASPTDGGLPDATAPGVEHCRRCRRNLSVQLWSTARARQNSSLNCPSPAPSSDVDHNWPNAAAKFVLAVFSRRTKFAPAHREYDGSTIGLLEDVSMVTIKTDQLPGKPDRLTTALTRFSGSMPTPPISPPAAMKNFARLQQYVRGGGHLVICSAELSAWQKSLGFGDLLPVTIAGVQTKSRCRAAENARHVRIARSRKKTDTSLRARGLRSADRQRSAVAQVKADGIVDTWIDWPDRPPSAYLARSHLRLRMRQLGRAGSGRSAGHPRGGK